MVAAARGAPSASARASVRLAHRRHRGAGGAGGCGGDGGGAGGAGGGSFALVVNANVTIVGISKLPEDAKYVAWIDADVQFLRPDWINATLEMLQKYPIVQLWSEALDLGPKNEILKVNTSLAYCYRESLKIGEEYGEYWHSGYAWAARMDFLKAVGGLVDATLVGAADHQMGMALAGRTEKGVHGQSHENLKQLVFDWAKKAEEFGKDNLGYVKGGLLHFWHGSKKARKYVERWAIVVENKFDPTVDIKKNADGLYEFSSDKPKLREDMKEYFRQRDEDGTEI